jgi:DNA polymerase elongation subunit (family B)
MFKRPTLVKLNRIECDSCDYKYVALRERVVPKEARFLFWKPAGKGYAFVGKFSYKKDWVGARSSGGEMPDGSVFVEEMVIDIDTKDVSKINEPLSKLPLRVYYTGGGYHLHVPIYAALSIDKVKMLESALRRVAKISNMPVDFQCTSWKHAIRTIGTPSPKHKTPKSFVFSNIKSYYADRVVLDVDALIKDFFVHDEVKTFDDAKGRFFISRPLLKAMTRGVREGERLSQRIVGRNTTMFILSSALFAFQSQLFHSEDDLINFLVSVNARFSPPLDVFELSLATRISIDRLLSARKLTQKEYEDAVSRIAKSVQRCGDRENGAYSRESISKRDNTDAVGYGQKVAFRSTYYHDASNVSHGKSSDVGVETVWRRTDADRSSQFEDAGRSVALQRRVGSVRFCGRENANADGGILFPDTPFSPSGRAYRSSPPEKYVDGSTQHRGTAKMAHIVDLFVKGDKIKVRYFDDSVEVFDVYKGALDTSPWGEKVIKLDRDRPVRFFNLGRSLRKGAKRYFSAEDTFFIVRSMKYHRLERMYGDLDLHKLRVLAVDIEVAQSDGRFPRPERESDRIAIISAAVCYQNVINVQVFYADELTADAEKKLLEDFWAFFDSVKPHIVIGHNIFGFDLPFLLKRSKMHNVNVPFDYEAKKSNKRVGERVLEFERICADGFQIIDTMILAAMYDVYARCFESYDLKSVARTLGVSSEGRTMINRDNVREIFEKSKDVLLRYAHQDAEETAKIFFVLAPPFFELTKIVPKTFEDVVLSGSGQLFDYYLLSQYIENRKALHEPLPFRKQKGGGFVAAFGSGFVTKTETMNIHHVDVESLYPSIMLKYNVYPRTDEERFFYQTLSHFTKRRLELKRAGKKAQSDALKIFINSAYGILSAESSYFRDVDKGEFVAAKGREILTFLIETIRKENMRPIICDTDGIIFAAENVSGEDALATLQKTLDDAFGGGVRLALEGSYDGVVVYRKKNYAVRRGDMIKIKGSTLRNRKTEKIFRELITAAIELALEGKVEEIDFFVKMIERRLMQRQVSAEDIVAYVSANDVSDERDLPQLRLRKLRESMGLSTPTGTKMGYYVSGVQTKKTFNVAQYVKPIEMFKPDDYSLTFYVGRRLKQIKSIIEGFAHPFVESNVEVEDELEEAD